ncbi:MAG: helix-turn-helix transcriptional regulator [Bacteroidales bacterium]|jgi:putative transcriptional regulator|nr:helix-turn-helix transcriptional regulator [Bacteroidales bacterium]MDD4001324.1 helix-turn-helix transcriptional regulator [Bacteroidales bacterium]MDD4528498.1 helix-turn-helix transcriptional regulator [Bacteroidales bacterium]
MKNNIRVERAILKMSQQQLADKVGVSRQTINAIELEKYVPSATVIMKIAVIFCKPVDNIFKLEETDW